ncbi:MAG: penicillin-binding protein [Acidimicrobiaceae bacterium]|nr:penicillin-binding protein [Acidimicrobiaceae bacterium]
MKRPHLPQWPWKKIGLGTALGLGVIVAVPPLRAGALNATSKAIFLAATPFAPNVSDFSALPQGTKVLASDGSLLVELDGTQSLQPVALKDLSPQMKHAVLAAEDAHFYSHPGVDAGALLRAAYNNVRGAPEQGGSTITQQLAKINYTNRQRTFFRKAREVLYAAQLERKFSKDELLQRYVNQVYFGEGAYGINAAAKTYFGTTPDKLDAPQAAMLAGKIRSPEGLNPRKDPERVKVRRDQVLRSMEKHGWLKKDELTAALAQPIALAPAQPVQEAKAPHFIELVKREAAGIDALGGSANTRATQLFTGGYTVQSTLDPKAFDASVAAVKKQLGSPGDPSTAVVSVAPGDGAIRNLFGGLDFANNQFDLASQGKRQPGSSFKPFVYLAALRQNIDPRSRFNSSSPMDVPCGSQTYHVANYEGEGGGTIPVDDALAKSVNTVFAQLACKAGLDKVVTAAKDDGLDNEKIDPVPSVALGGLPEGVTPLEMAAAYATFAAKGTYARPYSIVTIKDRSGRVVYTHSPQLKQVYTDKQVGVLTQALTGVIDHGTGKGAAIDRPVAGKTGTTELYSDAWFVGFVPQLATAVWVGHPDSRVEMKNVHGVSVAGGTFPASIFAATMKGALTGVPVQPLFTATPDQLNLKPTSGSDGPPASARPGQSTTTVSTDTTLPPDATPTSQPDGSNDTVTTPPPTFGRSPSTTSGPTTSTTQPPATTSTTAAHSAGGGPSTTTPP